MFPELVRQCSDVSAGEAAALEAHYELLLRWNRVLNLTAIENVEQAVERHYCEALCFGEALPLGHATVADVGSGAGFPGFPWRWRGRSVP